MSIRDVQELAPALAGGADLIDIKEPNDGSLGRASFHVIAAIANALERRCNPVPLSVALGELSDWSTAAVPRLPSNVGWVKLGLSGCAADPHWCEHWTRVRRQLTSVSPNANWIAVAYADHRAAEAPHPHAVLQAANHTGCAGVLMDTFTKTGQRLGDWIGPDELRTWLHTAREHGLITAVAGSLQLADLEWLRPLSPDIIAVRSAACRGGIRGAGIDGEAVANLKQLLTSPDRQGGVLRKSRSS